MPMAPRRLSATAPAVMPPDTRSKTGTKLVDSAAPVVSGVENGGVYCLTVDISVSDPHLDTVTLN